LRPKLPTNLKLLVAQAPFEERAYVNEVAEVLEEILQASENGLARLPPRNETRVSNIVNRVKLEEERRKIEEQKRKEERDAKIRKHHSQLRKEMERKRQEKLRKDEEQNRLAVEKRKIELEKQRKKEDERKKYLENQKRKLNQQKQKEMEELKAKTEADEIKKKEKQETLKKEKIKFLKDQKQKFKRQFNDRIQERKDLKNLESEIEYQKEMKKRRIKDNMVNYLKDHKEDREIEIKQLEELNDFYETYLYIFDENDNDIGKVFRHYSKQNAKTIDGKLENNVNSIDKEEFVKFGKNSKIVPKLLNQETLLHIFNTLAKERMARAGKDDEIGLALDQEAFEKGLIYIAVEGRDILGGSLKPKNKEEEKYTSRYQIGTRNKSRDRSEDNSESPDQRKKNKTLAGKKIIELQKKKPTYGTEIKDIKIGKTFDISSISPETIKSVISYISQVKI